MKQTISILKNKDGNAIVIAMMILVLLTIIGTSATRNTTVELQIVRNDIVHREQLYRAESAAMEGAQWLQNAPVSSGRSWKRMMRSWCLDFQTQLRRRALGFVQPWMCVEG